MPITHSHYADFDQILEDIKPENDGKFENLPLDEDLPGFGQFYCRVCARYSVSQDALTTHTKTTVHKRAYVQITLSFIAPSLVYLYCQSRTKRAHKKTQYP